MSSITTTLTDNHGDDLVLTLDEDGDLMIESANEETSYFSFRSDTAEALRKLRAFVNEALGEASVPGPRASEVSFNEGIMRLAAVHGQKVQFRYAKGAGTVIETRTLLPETVFEAKDGALLFGGQDPDRDEYRAYRMDRIKGEVTVG